MNIKFPNDVLYKIYDYMKHTEYRIINKASNEKYLKWKNEMIDEFYHGQCTHYCCGHKNIEIEFIWKDKQRYHHIPEDDDDELYHEVIERSTALCMPCFTLGLYKYLIQIQYSCGVLIGYRVYDNISTLRETTTPEEYISWLNSPLYHKLKNIRHENNTCISGRQPPEIELELEKAFKVPRLKVLIKRKYLEKEQLENKKKICDKQIESLEQQIREINESKL